MILPYFYVSFTRSITNENFNLILLPYTVNTYVVLKKINVVIPLLEIKMKKPIMITTILLITLLVVTIPAGAASWNTKITGGGQAVVGGTYFSINVSATEKPSGEFKGQMQYSRYDGTLDMHGFVKCSWVSGNGEIALAAGPAKAQNDPANFIGTHGGWMVVMIKEGGVGSGDTVRVIGSTEGVARNYCSNGYSGSFPGTLVDGNFNIRSR